jgi:hypothetical protein
VKAIIAILKKGLFFCSRMNRESVFWNNHDQGELGKAVWALLKDDSI